MLSDDLRKIAEDVILKNKQVMVDLAGYLKIRATEQANIGFCSYTFSRSELFVTEEELKSAMSTLSREDGFLFTVYDDDCFIMNW
jgi:hypothetical protein